MIRGGGGGRPKYDVVLCKGGGAESTPIATYKSSQNWWFRQEHITKPYLLKLGNYKAVAFLGARAPLDLLDVKGQT